MGDGDVEFIQFGTKVIQAPLLLTIWILLATCSKIIFHWSSRFPTWVPQSCVLISSGIIYGALFYNIRITTNVDNSWSIYIFFFLLLPPIVLDAGYYLHNSYFAKNLGAILNLAAFGTLWNSAAIAFSLYGLTLYDVFEIEMDLIECFLFGSLISAVDPVSVLAVFEEVHVNENLYMIMFGESLLNDGISVVLYNLFLGFKSTPSKALQYSDIGEGVLAFFVVSSGGITIGVLTGIITSCVTKFTNKVPEVEPLFMCSMAYLSYLLADMFHISGILAIISCALILQRYASHNVTPHSATTMTYILKMVSSVCESMIFLWLGVSLFGNYHLWNTAFILCSLFFCLLYRFIGVYVLIKLTNRWRLVKLDAVEQFILSYSGLRGAIAFALALSLIGNRHMSEEVKRMFLTTTIVIVLITTFFQSLALLVNGMDNIVYSKNPDWLIQKLRMFERKIIQPLVLKNEMFYADENTELLETCHNLNVSDILYHLKNYGGNHCKICRKLSNFVYNFRNYFGESRGNSLGRRTIQSVVWDRYQGDDAGEADVHHMLQNLNLKPKYLVESSEAISEFISEFNQNIPLNSSDSDDLSSIAVETSLPWRRQNTEPEKMHSPMKKLSETSTSDYKPWHQPYY